MTRFMKILSITGLSSVYLMQVGCVTDIPFTSIGNGLNILPFKAVIPNINALIPGLVT